jgi:hypothetical protein
MNGEGLARAERALEGQGAVHEVRRNPTAKSVLVRYDPDTADIATLLAAFLEAGVNIVLDNDPVDEVLRDVSELPDLGGSIGAFFTSADRRVAEVTGGRADLKTLVPVGLGILAVRELFMGRAVAAPWYVLAWYAFDSFIKLRHNINQPTDDSPPRA